MYFPYVIVIGLYALWGISVAGGVDLKAVASHVFLYKMFDSELDISICYPFWFISTIMDGADCLFAGVLCDGIYVSEMQGICRHLAAI